MCDCVEYNGGIILTVEGGGMDGREGEREREGGGGWGGNMSHKDIKLGVLHVSYEVSQTANLSLGLGKR
jgi:hypothetical protein